MRKRHNNPDQTFGEPTRQRYERLARITGKSNDFLEDEAADVQRSMAPSTWPGVDLTDQLQNIGPLGLNFADAMKRYAEVMKASGRPVFIYNSPAKTYVFKLTDEAEEALMRCPVCRHSMSEHSEGRCRHSEQIETTSFASAVKQYVDVSCDCMVDSQPKRRPTLDELPPPVVTDLDEELR